MAFRSRDKLPAWLCAAGSPLQPPWGEAGPSLSQRQTSPGPGSGGPRLEGGCCPKFSWAHESRKKEAGRQRGQEVGSGPSRGALGKEGMAVLVLWGRISKWEGNRDFRKACHGA